MTALHSRVYRALLTLYPPGFRHEYGDQLCDAFNARVAKHAGPFRHITRATAAIADVVPNAIASHAEILARDLRHLRSAARRSRLFYLGCILVLALGTGANGAVFSILQAVLLEPLPYERPSELVMLWSAWDPLPPTVKPGTDDARSLQRGVLTPNMLEHWRENTKDVFTDVAAMRSWIGNSEASFDIVLDDRAERLRGALATPNFFDVLGAGTWAGRTFTAADEASGERLAVISYALWQRAFGGEAGAIGRPLTITGGRSPRSERKYTVVGVLRPDFRFTYPQETEVWVLDPWSQVARYPREGLAFFAVARMKPGVTLAAAQARVRALPIGNGERNDRKPRAEPIAEWAVGSTRSSLTLLGGVAVALLAIACVTVGNALLVRYTARRRELALRASLGAHPRALVRQLVTEGAALALCGTLAGTLLAIAATPLLRSLVPPSYPRADEIGVNAWIIAFAAATAILTTVLAALAPAWRGSRFDLVTSLKQAAGTVSTDSATARWRRTLVAVQSGIATALLIAAALLMTSLWKLGRVELGFDARGVVTVEMRLLPPRYRDEMRVAALQTALVDRLRADPAIADVGLTTAVPFRGVDFMRQVRRVGDTVTVTPNIRTVDSTYFSIMNIELLRGRVFTSADAANGQILAVISDSLARHLFGNEDPIGKYIVEATETLVIGVVRDVRYRRLDLEPRPALYLSRGQVSSELICLVVRPRGDRSAAGAAIRRAVRDVDPSLPAMNLTTIEEIITSSESKRRFYTIATASFAVVAVLLTLAGLAIIVSRAVLERRREMAIRSALGGAGSRLVWPLLRQGIVPVVAGAAAGVATAVVAAPSVAPFLYEVSPRDPATYAAIAAFIIASGILTALIPSRRVARAVPADVLRTD